MQSKTQTNFGFESQQSALLLNYAQKIQLCEEILDQNANEFTAKSKKIKQLMAQVPSIG